MEKKQLIFSLNQYLNKENIEVGKFVSDKVNFHSHEFIEIVYFDCDNVCHRVENKYYSVDRGDLFLLNVGVAHNFYSTDPEKKETVVYNCLFDPKVLDEVLVNGSDFVQVMYYRLFHNFIENSGGPEGFIKLDRCVDADFKRLFMQMIAEKEKKEAGWQYKMQAYLKLLLVDILRVYDRQIRHEPLEDTQKNIVNKMIEYMSERIGEDVHVQMLSDTLFFSPSYLNRIFKSRMQVSILQYLQQLRMNAAGDLLRTTKKTVSEIAREVGYGDLKHFNLLFKRQYGMSPREYRESELE